MRIEYNVISGETTELPDIPSLLTNDEKKKIDLDMLNYQLQANFDSLTMQYAKALLAGGTSEAAKISAIRAQQTALKTQYSADVTAVITKYNNLQPV
jgi:hypothetical protein